MNDTCKLIIYALKTNSLIVTIARLQLLSNSYHIEHHKTWKNLTISFGNASDLLCNGRSEIRVNE